MKKKPEPTPDEILLRQIVDEFTRNHKALEIQLDKPGVIVIETCRDDHPRVVGASGRNIQALRTIFHFIAARRKERVNIILNEPTRGQRQPIVPYVQNPKWKPGKVVTLIKTILERVLASSFDVEPISARDTTLLELRISKEDERVVEILQPALQTIFHAIGRAQGHALHVVIGRSEVAEAIP